MSLVMPCPVLYIGVTAQEARPQELEGGGFNNDFLSNIWTFYSCVCVSNNESISFQMSGKEMCSLRKDDFCSRAPVFVGDILWEHLQLLQSECDREQAALKNAPPKLSEIAQNPAAISPTPPPPRAHPAYLTASPPPHRPYSAHYQPPSPSAHTLSVYPPFATSSHPSAAANHSPPLMYSDCSSSSPQRPPQSPPRVYATLESAGGGAAPPPRLFSPAAAAGCRASPQYHSQSPRPVSPSQQQQQHTAIKSEYPAYPGYLTSGTLYPGHQYPRTAPGYPSHNLHPGHAQFPAVYGGHQGYAPAAYPLFQSGHGMAAMDGHAAQQYQLGGRWPSSESHPGAYQVKTLFLSMPLRCYRLHSNM
jgi:hypothetical protein